MLWESGPRHDCLSNFHFLLRVLTHLCTTYTLESIFVDAVKRFSHPSADGYSADRFPWTLSPWISGYNTLTENPLDLYPKVSFLSYRPVCLSVCHVNTIMSMLFFFFFSMFWSQKVCVFQLLSYFFYCLIRKRHIKLSFCFPLIVPPCKTELKISSPVNDVKGQDLECSLPQPPQAALL